MLLLVHDTLGTLDVDPPGGSPYITEQVDVPMAAVRAVADDRTEAHGTYDHTAYVGARAVTVRIACFADTEALEDVVARVRAYCNPALRWALVWDPVGGGARRRLAVRAAGHDYTAEDPRWARTTLSLVAPGGLVESDALHQVHVPATTTLEAQGRAYNLTFDRTYPAGGGAAGTAVVNAGSAPVTTWRALLYGPCTDPALENLTTGEGLFFTGLTVAQGAYVELDAAAHTARLESDPDLSVYNRLDSARSTWWPLVAGTNAVRYRPFGASAGAEAIVEWRDAWL